ncbi:hypothetical protein B296_00038833 [Ensete ventricosum]|uniref:Uncharacterized protein n=1 Tax=Ensete ventricosum TaxID=4639 RepID=A0A426YS40_ENSVE|nr:hypothetical protein B296_00038833 [Ensete ventricosum]
MKSRELSLCPKVPMERQIDVIVCGPIASGVNCSARKAYARVEVQKRPRPPSDPGITFESEDEYLDHDDALVVMAYIVNARVRRIMIDTRSFADILYLDVFHKLGMTNRDLILMTSTLTGFTSDAITLVGVATLLVTFDDEPRAKTLIVPFMVVDLPSAYNIIIGRPTLNKLRAVVSIYHRIMKFPTSAGPREIKSDPRESALPEDQRIQLIDFLGCHSNVFAWSTNSHRALLNCGRPGIPYSRCASCRRCRRSTTRSTIGLHLTEVEHLCTTKESRGGSRLVWVHRSKAPVQSCLPSERSTRIYKRALNLAQGLLVPTIYKRALSLARGLSVPITFKRALNLARDLLVPITFERVLNLAQGLSVPITFERALSLAQGLLVLTIYKPTLSLAQELSVLIIYKRALSLARGLLVLITFKRALNPTQGISVPITFKRALSLAQGL